MRYSRLVVDICTIQLLSTLATLTSLIIYQAEFATACLNVEIDKDAYMQQPTGYTKVLSKDEDNSFAHLKGRYIRSETI